MPLSKLHPLERYGSAVTRLVVVIPLLLALSACKTDRVEQVGPLDAGTHLTSTYQLLRPAGNSIEFGGRPVDLALGSGRLFVKDMKGVLVVDTDSWRIQQDLKYKAGGASTHGIALSRDETLLYVTTAEDGLWEAAATNGSPVAWLRKITLPGPDGKGNSHPAGIALSPDGARALVCLSRNNALGVVDLRAGKLVREIAVGVAPYDVVLTTDGRKAFVSNWGGRRAGAGERTAKSSGTDAVVDERGVGASGTVSVVDVREERELQQVATGLHPSDLELTPDGRTLFVANANSDSVAVIEVASAAVVESVSVLPDSGLPFGSAPNALALDAVNSRLYVANGGNNAVAVLALEGGRKPTLQGFIPTGWYPGALCIADQQLYIANVKGFGSRKKAANRSGWNSHNHLGTVTKVPVPLEPELERYTRQVAENARVPEILRATEKLRAGTRPVPVPRRPGEPSVFEHVVYIIKENRTYDQLFGDLPQGKADPSLCVFGREVTPNHHALAEEFVLLDNYYCNGVLSADGHAWAMEGYVTDYLEKSFGGFTRSYPFSGDDPLSFAPTGFIWDNALLHGLSFRNYGEMNATAVVPANASYADIFHDYQSQAGKIAFKHSIAIDTLRRYSCPDSPGWNMRIPDQIRADAFLREFKQHEASGSWPNLVIIYLPSDHTSGTRPGNPTPRAQVADNDLALGRIVEAISSSRFWPKTCIFVNEDDPQAGFDHVDGHRSICLVVSPYTKRGKVISKFYNQTSVLHTMERMLGLPPMNQMDALSPLMTDCFTKEPDFAAYRCRPNQIPLDEMNKAVSELEGDARHWALLSLEQNLDQVDQADEDTLNRIIWHSVKGTDTPYPAELAGAHGKGLRAMGLRLTPEGVEDEGD